MNLKIGFITISIVAFSPFVLAQEKVFNDVINGNHSVLIAENSSGSSSESKEQLFEPKGMQDNNMLEAYESKVMDENIEETMDDKQGHQRIHHKRA
ncbi:hypothetical protein [Vibrio ezurae]|uniref:Uncharacterized protein n=1 Tax=Vibrio ezurae NBRC 102218 TaxID=1219080 RepID=U3AKC7_9VIBR|nr:hypothetical protein [Vibrio ezurae]GAD80361.1 hypothetical protein VEZ01S_33_00630 [Vibrio ezurae NBRC 102218]